MCNYLPVNVNKTLATYEYVAQQCNQNFSKFITVDDYKDIIIKIKQESRYCPGTKRSPHFTKTHVCRSFTRKAQDMRAKLQEINKKYSADIECTTPYAILILETVQKL
uniref:Uncharacterized protein n=1 Tax=Glossina austeni TaxID=7395 RepID=A0A1A9V2U2_GLOAU